MAGMNTSSLLYEVQNQIVSALSGSIGSGAVEFKRLLRSKTPVNRRKTRRYTTSIHRLGELSAVAGVVFPADSRFETDGTRTRKIVERVYREDSATVLAHIADQLKQAIEQQPIKTIEIRKR